MNSNIDYYRILGVLDDAEDVVIRAAYRALAQRYHPDKWRGDVAEATRRMAEINAAYGVLSDAAKRASYDSKRGDGAFDPDPESRDKSEEFGNEVDEKWRFACEYFPDLINIANDLNKLSSTLAFTFRLTLIDSQGFSDSRKTAQKLENKYLEKYFGKNEKLKKYAKSLIINGRKYAAKELNKVVCVLGENFPIDMIIKRIEDKFPPLIKRKYSVDNIDEKKQKLINSIYNFYAYRTLAVDFVSCIGGELQIDERDVPFLFILTAREQVFKLTLNGETKLLSPQEFLVWLRSL